MFELLYYPIIKQNTRPPDQHRMIFIVCAREVGLLFIQPKVIYRSSNPVDVLKGIIRLRGQKFVWYKAVAVQCYRAKA